MAPTRDVGERESAAPRSCGLVPGEPPLRESGEELFDGEKVMLIALELATPTLENGVADIDAVGEERAANGETEDDDEDDDDADDDKQDDKEDDEGVLNATTGTRPPCFRASATRMWLTSRRLRSISCRSSRLARQSNRCSSDADSGGRSFVMVAAATSAEVGKDGPESVKASQSWSKSQTGDGARSPCSSA